MLPKPLIPVFHRPLIAHAFDHLRSAGVREFVVNTHHLPQAYQAAFPGSQHDGLPIHFREEQPLRLETGGGLANVRDLLGDDAPFLVYNGDILTDLPLAPLIQQHQQQGNLVTLVLRSTGPAQVVAYDATQGLITDIRNLLGTGNPGTHLFTGIYAVSPAFFRWLTPGKVESVVAAFLRAMQAGERIGGVVIDDGQWWDLGSREAYLDVHRANLLSTPAFPHEPAIHPTSHVAADASLEGFNVIGPQAKVGAGARLQDCLLWPGAIVAPGAQLTRCIVRTGCTASGELTNADV